MTTTHVTVSHGSDFFGVDCFTARQLRDLGQHAPGILPYTEHPPLTELLDTAGDTDHTIDATQAAQLAPLLRRIANSRGLAKQLRQAALLLAQAAARAATEHKPWTWTCGTPADTHR